MNEENLKNYLAGATAEDYQSLAEHDKVYHKGGYKDGDACKVRDALKKSDNPDGMIAKAGAMEGRVKARKDVAGALEDVFGGKVRFNENEKGGDDEVSFSLETSRGLKWGERCYERELEDMGYKAAINISGWTVPQKVSGSIRKFTPQEKFDRVKAEKPKWNSDGEYEVDGTYYDSKEEAMEGWQKAMKKYGSMVKKGVSSQDSAPAKTYLQMCQDWAPGRRHADGSACKAKSPESCPFEKKAEEADKGVSSGERDAGSGDDDLVKRVMQHLYKSLADEHLGDSDITEDVMEKRVRDEIKRSGKDDEDELYDELIESVMSEAQENKERRVGEDSRKYNGQKYDSIGAPNW